MIKTKKSTKLVDFLFASGIIYEQVFICSSKNGKKNEKN